MKNVAIKLLVDRSGSMQDTKDAAESGIREFIQERQNEKNASQVISIDQFNTSYETVYDFVDIHSAPEYKMNATGMTALLDSIAHAVESLEKVSADEKFLVVMTDGLENSSREYTKPAIKSLLQKKQEQGWHVIYLGANQDAIAIGNTYGISRDTSMTYDTSHSKAALSGVSYVMRSASASGWNGQSVSFRDSDRDAAVGK